MSRHPHNYERIYSGGEMDPHARQPSAPPPNYGGTQRANYLRAGDVRRMQAVKCPDSTLTYTNYLAVSSSDFEKSVRFVRVNEQYIFNILPIPGLPSGKIGPTKIQR
ncbi:hypothetical protein LPJ66_012160, partial [Kickxella alabastrina]